MALTLDSEWEDQDIEWSNCPESRLTFAEDPTWEFLDSWIEKRKLGKKGKTLFSKQANSRHRERYAFIIIYFNF